MTRSGFYAAAVGVPFQGTNLAQRGHRQESDQGYLSSAGFSGSLEPTAWSDPRFSFSTFHFELSTEFRGQGGRRTAPSPNRVAACSVKPAAASYSNGIQPFSVSRKWMTRWRWKVSPFLKLPCSTRNALSAMIMANRSRPESSSFPFTWLV